MKTIKLSKKRTVLLLSILAVLVIGITGVAIKRDWLQRQYAGHQLKTTLSGEIRKFEKPLTAMGFDISKVESRCFKDDTPAGMRYTSAPGLQCTASINSYKVIGNDPAKLASLNKQAAEMSSLLTQNGWKQRDDLPTISWFQKISQGVDYQPDQLNSKQVGDTTCTIDFYTAFSKPAPVAISLKADCYRPGLPTLE